MSKLWRFDESDVTGATVPPEGGGMLAATGVSSGGARRRLARPRGGRCPGLGEADQREVSERQHGPSLNEPHALAVRGPMRVALPSELGAPAEFARRRRKPVLQGAAQTRFRPDSAYQHDLAARL